MGWCQSTEGRGLVRERWRWNWGVNGGGGNAVVLESKVEDLRKDSEETWA